ncbi:hypothetical protein [Nostoc sp. TCL240-02]|uniref:hypothetical protein n=1 Tax=Nostoc sp. TCL240-02 TaxID=2572090 RepID=UPI00157F909C|nr:hypothetical protein [Nostoc sp. TCL240-02]QKQ73154.1 hypothetical protein FBB35_06995 [Nostoc sp. TCL240-02]
MTHPHDRISNQAAAELFTLAARLQAQRQHEYSSTELMQAGVEADLSPEILQEALQQMQAKQQQDQHHRRLRYMVGSGIAGAAIAISGLWAYQTIAKALSHRNNLPQATLEQADRLTTAPDPQPPVENDSSSFTGIVEQYLLNPEGRVDGLLLKNGLEVKFPLHLSDRLTRFITPGTEVSITGAAGSASRFGQEVRAMQIVDRKTQQAIVDQPPDEPPQPLRSSNYSTFSTAGTIQHWLVGHRGELHGLILSSKVQIKFPPHVGDQLSRTVQIGDRIQAQGFGTRNQYGQILQATALTVNGQLLSMAPVQPKAPLPQP